MFWKTDKPEQKPCPKAADFLGKAKKELKRREKERRDRELQKWNDFFEEMEDLDQYN